MSTMTLSDLLQREPAFAILAVVAGLYVWGICVTRSKRLPLPPGPRRLPIIGNLLDLPPVRPWLRYSEWAKRYGRLFLTRW